MATYAVEMHREDPDSEDLKSLGTRAELRAALLSFNTCAETEQFMEELSKFEIPMTENVAARKKTLDEQNKQYK